ncbi:MAG: hypothetical protein H6738_07535 [Alphaproteobacteria bacterium]|nr:hypothetical protein [Alphaproteobacteria bacterium]MCB9696616.1 hypothetical protein [Alphaproteobacteria bacterium]
MSREDEGTELEDETHDELEPGEHGDDQPQSSRVFRFARRLMNRGELAEDTKELLNAVLNTSDKAKTEAVRIVAREVRGYLKELKLKESLMDLATSHSLEISIHLKPLHPPAASSDDGKE